MHRFYLYQDGKAVQDITPLISSPQLRDEWQALSLELTATVLRNDKEDRYCHWPDIRPGDKLRVVNEDREVFGGTILTVGLDGAIMAANPGWNLSRSEICLQLNRAAAPDAVRQLGAKAGIPVGQVSLPPTRISKVWWGSTPESILQHILEVCSAETGKVYQRRVRDGALQVTELPETPIVLRHTLPGQGSFDASLAKGSLSGSDSAEELINAVILTAGSGKKRYQLGEARDEASIARFGLLQKVESLSQDETEAQARQRVRNLLQQGNRIRRERTIDHLWGDDRCVSGCLVHFRENRYDVSGVMRVKSVTHQYGADHTMSLTVEYPEEVTL